MKAKEFFSNALGAGVCLDGTEKNQYQIESVLGSGNFGITYQARDTLLNSTVAIKEYMPPDFAVRGPDGTSVVARSSSVQAHFDWGLHSFLEEARTLKLFREQNIVRVESFIQANGTAYMVMEYEEGQPLDAVLNEGGELSEQQLRQIFIPILKGLRAVHQQHYLHRDIKPGNIFLRRRGGPVLLDFGAARQALIEQSRSITGILTAGYAPFEQYSNTRKLTPAADLYAVGATIYRCLTGQKPVDAPERVAAMHAGEPDPFVPVQTLCANRFSADFLKAVDWCLQPLAKDRPQSADELLAVIDENSSTLERTEITISDFDPSLTSRLQADLSQNPTHLSIPTSSTTASSAPAWAPQPAVGGIERRWGWKLLFMALIGGLGVIVPITLLWFGAYFSNFELQHLMGWSLWSVMASVPLFGYAFQRRLGPTWLWQGLWLVSVVLLAVDAVWCVMVLSSLDMQARYRLYLYLMGATVWLVPFFLYAFRERLHKQSVYVPSKFALVWALLLTLVIAPVFFAQWQNQRALKVALQAYESSRYQQAYEAFVVLAEQDQPLAQFYLGKMHRFGIGRPVDTEVATKWFDAAIARGVVDLISNEANFGNPVMQSNLGVMYFEGIGLERNPVKAAHWYQKAAQLGYALGQNNYATQLYHGLGVEQNYAQAAYWYGLSAQQGYAQPQYALGNMNMAGQGIEQDYVQAKALYEQAAEYDYYPAEVGLALIYQNGLGVDKDMARAYSHFRRAAERGDLNAQRGLANLYALGEGVERDPYQAKHWYELAAAQGDSIAQNELGYIYGVGEGVPKDYERSLYWYRQAAEQDNTTAQFNLGVMYETGRGVAKSLSDATVWYQRAAHNNHAQAKKALQRLIQR